MKKLIILAFVTFFVAMNMQVRADIDTKPESLPAKEVAFPSYETITLSNGLKVFVVKDDQQPTVNFRILVKGGQSVEGEKTGVADLTASILMKGAGTRSALDIATVTDGLGIILSTASSADYNTVSGACLKKHFSTLLELTRDLLTAPTFPQDEFVKLQKLMIASIKNEKSQASSVASAISRKAAYGLNHPYAVKASESGVNAITVSDLQKYFKEFFLPNNATMVIVGDVTASEIKSLLEKSFSSWKKGKTPQIAVPNPEPLPIGVYFVSRPGAVQSSVAVVSRSVPRNHPDYLPIKMAINVMGAGFGGRLFRTLRETYSYTYTPHAYQSSTKYANRTECGADVRANVTDSSIAVINEQLNLLCSQTDAPENLSRMKKFIIGQYFMAFASKDYVGNLIQNADFLGQNIEEEKTQHIKIQKMSATTIKDAADKYLNPKDAYIVVVGDPSVKEKLAKFGKIYEFNMDYEPETGENAKFDKVNMTLDQICNKYADAIGGKSKINSTNTLSAEGKLTFDMQGETVNGSIIQKFKTPNSYYQMMDLGMMKQATWFNGTKAWGMAGGPAQELSGDDLASIKGQSAMFIVAKLADNNYKCEVLGLQKGFIVLKANIEGSDVVFYLDADTYLLMKKESVEKMEDTPLPITETYSEYKNFDGIKFPTKVVVSTPLYSINQELEYKVNPTITDSEFQPK